jgi:hypothetical protein
MENATAIISLIITLIGLVSALIPVIIKLVSVFKKLAKEKNWQKIVSAVYSAIVEAEKLSITGAEKKEFVLKTIKTFCTNLEIDFPEDEVSALIDSLITITKEINVK